jgi:hypothetical protein
MCHHHQDKKWNINCNQQSQLIILVHVCLSILVASQCENVKGQTNIKFLKQLLKTRKSEKLSLYRKMKSSVL